MPISGSFRPSAKIPPFAGLPQPNEILTWPGAVQGPVRPQVNGVPIHKSSVYVVPPCQLVDVICEKVPAPAPLDAVDGVEATIVPFGTIDVPGNPSDPAVYCADVGA